MVIDLLARDMSLNSLFVIPLITFQLNQGNIDVVFHVGDSMPTATVDYAEIQRYQLENSVSADDVIKEIQLKLREQNAVTPITTERQ